MEEESSNIEKVAENQDTYGRLRFVSRIRIPKHCRECKNMIETGSPCFTQSDYTTESFFPVQTRVCMKCGQIQIKEGIEVKNLEMYDKYQCKEVKPNKMTTLKEEAQAYEPSQTKVVSDLEVVRTDADILEAEGVGQDGTPFKYKYMIVDDVKYRVPASVLEQIQTILKSKPDTKTIKVDKKGSGMGTSYTVVQLD